MDFSDTTNKTGIVEDIDFNVNSNSVTYPLADKARKVNNWYLQVIGWILESSPDWEWDDSNYSDFPIGTATLVNGQEDYTLPVAVAGADASTFLRLLRVEILDKDGDYYKIDPYDESDFKVRGVVQASRPNGLPIRYRTIGNSLKLDPAPDTTLVTAAAGLKVFYQRTPDLFTASDTTQEPGFPSIFHPVLSLGASYDYAMARGLKNRGSLKKEIERYEKAIKSFYGNQNEDMPTRIGVRGGTRI